MIQMLYCKAVIFYKVRKQLHLHPRFIHMKLPHIIPQILLGFALGLSARHVLLLSEVLYYFELPKREKHI